MPILHAIASLSMCIYGLAGQSIRPSGQLWVRLQYLSSRSYIGKMRFNLTRLGAPATLNYLS